MLGDKQKRFRIRFAPDTEPIFFRDVEEMHCEGRRGREFRRMHGHFQSRPERFPPGGRGAMPLPAGDFLSDARHFAETGDAVVDVGGSLGVERTGEAYTKLKELSGNLANVEIATQWQKADR